MSEGQARYHRLDEDAIRSFLSRVRQTDPEATETAVRRFLTEMDEAKATLDSLDVGDAQLPVAYSAAWPEGGGTPR